MTMTTIGTPALWAGFVLFVLVMLAVDLGVFHRKSHVISLREAGVWSAVWFGLAVLFAGVVGFTFGPERALEFSTGYLIEKALAVDNIFVFVVIFAAFGIPALYQHRVLFWGVLGALVMRAGFILAGGALIQRFEWVMYLFGALLVATGIKLLVQREKVPEPQKNPLVKLFRKLVATTAELRGGAFTVVEGGKRYATPLLLALVAVEVTDLVFAVDSIPAIFAVTKDPFIVFTSNIFAILGLRSLYFLLAGVIGKFAHLKIGLALVLVFVGAKMCLVDFYKVPVAASLVVIALILGASVLASLRWPPKSNGASLSAPAPGGVQP